MFVGWKPPSRCPLYQSLQGHINKHDFSRAQCFSCCVPGCRRFGWSLAFLGRCRRGVRHWEGNGRTPKSIWVLQKFVGKPRHLLVNHGISMQHFPLNWLGVPHFQTHPFTLWVSALFSALVSYRLKSWSPVPIQQPAASSSQVFCWCLWFGPYLKRWWRRSWPPPFPATLALSRLGSKWPIKVWWIGWGSERQPLVLTCFNMF